MRCDELTMVWSGASTGIDPEKDQQQQMAKRSKTITGAMLRNLLAALAAAAVGAVVVVLLIDIINDSTEVSATSTPTAAIKPAALGEPTSPTFKPKRPFKSPGFRMPRRPRPLQIVNQNTYPTKLAEGPRGWIYVTDAKSGSVFYYDQNLKLRHELKGIRRPLGIAVDRMFVMVGSDATDGVEFYGKFTGKKHFTLGKGEIKMPSDMVLDGRGKLYVVDSRSHVVRVYGLKKRRWLLDIGEPGTGPGQLASPKSVAVVRRRDSNNWWKVIEEVFVADQGNKRIQVFDTEGTFLRYYDAREPEVAGFSLAGKRFSGMGGFGWNLGSDDPFQKIQSLMVDNAGRIHALDLYTHKILVLDSGTGEVLGDYGDYGVGPGELNLPLDILITKQGKILITNTLNKRIEVLEGVQ